MNRIGAAQWAAHHMLYAETGDSPFVIGWQYPQSANSIVANSIAAHGDHIELRLSVPEASAGYAQLCCRLKNGPESQLQIRRLLGRAHHDQRSSELTAGLLLLLTISGWIVGGNAAAQALVAAATPSSDAFAVPSETTMRQRFGAQPLDSGAMPQLFGALTTIARRAGLHQLPKLYRVAEAQEMNAYALGASDASAIALTDGLLRGMRHAEVAAIVAHEVAHICANDAWTMGFARALQQAIAVIAPMACDIVRRQTPHAPPSPLATLLTHAPALAQLLTLGLSRMRERDADTMALQLTDDPQALVTALAKLEHHHNRWTPSFAIASQDLVTDYLRSHPTTQDRVGHVMAMA